MNSYKELIVWQKSIELCERVYLLTNKFPTSEIYGLTNQIRRASVAIPSNIAEGQRRGHRSEYIQFLRIAYGSAAELETQLIVSLRIGYVTQADYEGVNDTLEQILKMLNKIIHSLLQPTT